MPDFAIIPELPAGYPINGNRSVARIVSAQTVVVSQTPVVTSPVSESGMLTVVSLNSLPIIIPIDQLAQNLTPPSVSGVGTDTGAYSYSSATEVARAIPSDGVSTGLTAPTVTVDVTETTAVSTRGV